MAKAAKFFGTNQTLMNRQEGSEMSRLCRVELVVSPNHCGERALPKAHRRTWGSEAIVLQREAKWGPCSAKASYDRLVSISSVGVLAE
jgi:hypothetical protein